MSRYEVCLRAKADGGRWSMMFDADDFAHAEDQCVDYLRSNTEQDYTDKWTEHWEIIRIEKDYA